MSGAVQLGCWARGAGACAPRARLDLRRRGAAARWAPLPGPARACTTQDCWGRKATQSWVLRRPGFPAHPAETCGIHRASRRRGRARTPYRMVFISVKVTLRVSISFLTIFFSSTVGGQRAGNVVPKGVMASSRVHMPPRLSSTAELIPAAGQWTRCRAFSACLGRGAALFVPGPRLRCIRACRSDHRHAYPCTMGHTWYAQGGDLTARRRQLGSHVTEDEVRFRTKREARALVCSSLRAR